MPFEKACSSVELAFGLQLYGWIGLIMLTFFVAPVTLGLGCKGL